MDVLATRPCRWCPRQRDIALRLR